MPRKEVIMSNQVRVKRFPGENLPHAVGPAAHEVRGAIVPIVMSRAT